MGFWLLFGLFVGTTVLSALLQKKPKDAQPSALGDFNVPTAQEGRPIPVIFGTIKVTAPNVIWYGDLRIDPIKKGAGLLSFGKKVVIGYKYWVGLWLSLCHGPIDDVISLHAGTHPDDKPVPFTKATVGDHIELFVDQVKLFGGEEKEGGLYGTFNFYTGTQVQGSDPYIGAKLAITAPAYRGVCHTVARQIYVGTSQHIKPLSFVLRRCPNNLGLLAPQVNINGDANPAEMLYETLTNRVWGIGRPANTIDVNSFKAAGQTLAAEGMGLSMQIDNKLQADNFMQEILRHIDGAMYTDPATGLWTLKLSRSDYDPATLPEFGPADIIGEPEFSRGSWEETGNQIMVKFIDRSQNFRERLVKADESANYATRGEIAAETIPFLGFTNTAIAQKAAAREMKTHSYPLATVRIKVSRKAWDRRIAGLFKFTWPLFGVSGMACRITDIDYGKLEQGEITLQGAEDIFSVAFTGYTPPSGSGWLDPFTDAQPPTAQLALEAPYHLLAEPEIRVIATCVRADGTSFQFDVWVDEGAGFFFSNSSDAFCPSGVLVSDYLRNTAALDTVGFVLQGTRDLDSVVSTDAAGRNRGDILALIDGEIMSVTTLTDNGNGTWTIAGILRAVLDTVPADHLAGARVWLFTEGAVFTREAPYPADVSDFLKCLPTNVRGTVPIGSVSSVPFTTASRFAKPYPPGKVQVNGLFWPVSVVLDATLTWEHRQRVIQKDGNVVAAQDATAASLGVSTPEGTYTVEVYVNNVLKQTVAGQTDTTDLYTALQRYVDDADGSHAVKFRIKPINVLTGTVRDTDAFRMSGFGMGLGQDFGGANA